VSPLLHAAGALVCAVVSLNLAWWFMENHKPTLLNVNLMFWPVLAGALATVYFLVHL
jgi:hypothetical protein